MLGIPKKLSLPVLFVALGLSVQILWTPITHLLSASSTPVAQVEQTQVPGGPYNDVIGPLEQPTPKPEVEQPLP